MTSNEQSLKEIINQKNEIISLQKTIIQMKDEKIKELEEKLNETNKKYFQCIARHGSDQTINKNEMAKLSFNGNNCYINYNAWDTSNYNFIAPFTGNFIFRLDANLSAKSVISSRPSLAINMFINNQNAENKGTNWVDGISNRIENIFIRQLAKGDIVDFRICCGEDVFLTYARGGGFNYQDSGLYIWNI